MKRRQLVELEDLPWWPRVFRDAETDYLAAALRVTKTYAVMAPRLAAALKRCGATGVVDLCSGGGGPWAELLPAVRAAAGADVSLCLTDKYPNTAALAQVAGQIPGVRFEAVFSAFHHFRPADARAILASAVRDRQGIAVFEAASRTPGALAMMLLVPLAVWLITPVIRPFRWSRLFWTYVVPVLPVVTMFDGIVSCLRIYTPAELKAMAVSVGGEAFDWDAGVDYPSGSVIPIPYLIGTPRHL
jgi:hypothetical protein